MSTSDASSTASSSVSATSSSGASRGNSSNSSSSSGSGSVGDPVVDGPVLVTGATGFVAYEVVKQLLERGYQVRGTVRDLKNKDKYRHLLQLPHAEDRLTLVEADLLDATSIKRAVHGTELVFHTASPYQLNTKNPQRDLVDPAVSGTLVVLKACRKAGTVTRVILTSSVAAITDSPAHGVVYDESMWNETSSLKRNPYYYSKKRAEEEAWKYMKESKPAFDLVVINPGVVIGPQPGPGVNQSHQVLVAILNKSFPILDISWAFVDVRDVGKAHIAAAEHEDAAGRYLTAAHLLNMYQLVGLMKKLFPEHAKRLPTMRLDNGCGTCLVKLQSRVVGPKGQGQFLRANLGRPFYFDNSKIVDELGLDFRDIGATVSDTVADLVENKGALSKKGKK